MVTQHRGISLKLDKNFFEKVFEPNRKQLQKILEIKITQQRFSKMIKGFKFNLNLKNEIKNEKFKKFKKR